MFGLFTKKPEFEDRTVDSVIDGILEALVDNTRVSGPLDFEQGLIKMARYHAKDKEFADAVSLVAQKTLALFPNDIEPEAEDDYETEPEQDVITLTQEQYKDIQNSATIEEAKAKLEAIIGADELKEDAAEEEKAQTGETTAVATTDSATNANDAMDNTVAPAEAQPQ